MRLVFGPRSWRQRGAVAALLPCLLLSMVLTMLSSQRATAADAPVAAPASSAAKASTLEQALAAYRSAQEAAAAADRPAAFARAERLFAAATKEGTASAELWTNLGTAALQAEHLGTAILAYRRALAIDPDHRHAQQNLTHARTLLPLSVPRPESRGFLDSLLAWEHALSAGERHGAAALSFLIAAVMLGAALATGSGALRLFTVFPLAVWGLLVASETFAAAERGGVLTAADTVARAADSRNAPARFAEPLPAGTEVTIAEVRGDWARIVLADGRDAWITATAVEPVIRN
jgi:tetratricopeptide (TPR) repeat protein